MKNTKTDVLEKHFQFESSQIMSELYSGKIDATERLEYLLASLSPDTTELMGEGVRYSDFIGPTVAVYSEPGLFSKPYFLDDISVYDTLVENLLKTNALIKDRTFESEQQRLFNLAFHSVNRVQFLYFENVISDHKAQQERTRILADIIENNEVRPESEESPESKVSISDLRSSAMCMERAVVCHNMFRFLGVQSTLRTGKLYTGEKYEYHAWVEIERDDGVRYLYDPTNPLLIVNSDNVITTIQPLLIKLEEGEVPSITWKILDSEGNTLKEKELSYS